MIIWLLKALRSRCTRIEAAYINEGERYLLKILGQAGTERGIAFREAQIQRDLDRLVENGLAHRLGRYCFINDAGLSRLRSNSGL